MSSPSAPSDSSGPGMALVCAALEGASGYSPVAAMGPAFPQAPVPVYEVPGVSGVKFASKPQSAGVPAEDLAVQFAYGKSASDELRMSVCVKLSGSIGGYAYSAPIDSQGGQHPVVANTFLANADEDPAQELVVLVAWEVEDALGTAGRLLEPWVFDLPVNPGALQRVAIADPALSFGFDGMREGEPVRYPYTHAAAFRSRLKELEY